MCQRLGLDCVRPAWYRLRVRTFLVAAVAVVALAVPASGLAVLAPGGGDGLGSATPDVRKLTIVASGDLLIHQPVWARALANGGDRYDFRPMFRALRPLLRGATLAFCHAETPMGPGTPSGYPVFNTPPGLARAIAWAGFDACSAASNHSVDQGLDGIRTTLRALDRAGVRHAGIARSRREARRITMLDADGVQVALLSYTYGTNGIPVPRAWAVNLIRPAQIRLDARRATRLGADLVLVNLHWGTEYVHQPTSQQRDVARRILRSRAVDLILGQHAHVVQPIGRLRGRFVVFGEGNLLSAQTSACCPGPTQDGLVAVVRVHVEGGRVSVGRVDYVPIYVRRPDFVVLPVRHRLRQLRRLDRSSSAEASLLRASYRRTVSVVGSSRRTRPLPGGGG